MASLPAPGPEPGRRSGSHPTDAGARAPPGLGRDPRRTRSTTSRPCCWSDGSPAPTLDQMALASFIDNAALERHLRSMRRRYRAKRTSWSASTSASTSPRSASAAPKPACTCSPGSPRTRPRTKRPCGPAFRRQPARTAPPLHDARASPPALLLGFALPNRIDLVTAVGLLAQAIC